MQFLVIYRLRSSSEESDRRTLQLFSNWAPPFEFKAHWARGDSEGGVALVEADSAAQVLEGTAPWTAYFQFDITPAIPIEEAIPIFQKANEWRASVG